MWTKDMGKMKNEQKIYKGITVWMGEKGHYCLLWTFNRNSLHSLAGFGIKYNAAWFYFYLWRCQIAGDSQLWVCFLTSLYPEVIPGHKGWKVLGRTSTAWAILCSPGHPEAKIRWRLPSHTAYPCIFADASWTSMGILCESVIPAGVSTEALSVLDKVLGLASKRIRPLYK